MKSTIQEGFSILTHLEKSSWLCLDEMKTVLTGIALIFLSGLRFVVRGFTRKLLSSKRTDIFEKYTIRFKDLVIRQVSTNLKFPCSGMKAYSSRFI